MTDEKIIDRDQGLESGAQVCHQLCVGKSPFLSRPQFSCLKSWQVRLDVSKVALTWAKLWTQSHQGLIQLRLFGDGWGRESIVNLVPTHTFLGDDVIASSFFNSLLVFLSTVRESCLPAGKLASLWGGQRFAVLC